jgi:hypothetical protein
MRRTISAAALLVAVAASTTGCGFFHKSDLNDLAEYHLFVTGAGTDKIDYAMTNSQKGSVDDETVANPKLPWTIAGVAYPGKISITVTPVGAPATCRIVVEKKELVKKQGAPGQPLVCEAKIKS